MKYLILIISVLILSACQSQQNVSESVPSLDSTTKQGDTTLTGKVTQSGDRFMLLDSDGKQTEIDSYKIDFSTYVGKTVSITGQYSGDTLFAASIKE